jgi:putative flippase GtrA
MPNLKKIILTFLKAQFSSIVSTLFDFTTTFLLTSIMGCWYIFSSVTGTISGGVLNFILGRYWVFNAKAHDKGKQIFRYIIIWVSSLILNTVGLYLLTHTLHLHYLLSKTITAVIVGFCFNFYFQNTFVFSKNA